MRFLILCWTELGLRFAEALRISAWDVDTEANTVSVIQKGDKPRTFPLTANIRTAIEPLWPVPPGEARSPLFALLHPRLKSRNMETVADTARRLWARVRAKSGVRHELNPHDLRRTMLTTFYRQTLDIQATQQIAGHQSLETTTHYLAPHDPERLRSMLNQLHWNWKLPTQMKQ
jgi:integrase/recombinase XerC